VTELVIQLLHVGHASLTGFNNDIDIGDKPYLPRPDLDIRDHIDKMSISATDHIGHIHIGYRLKQVMPYVSVTLLFALHLKFTSQFTLCEFVCIGIVRVSAISWS